MVTHSMAQAAHLGERLIMMHKGKIIRDFSGAAKGGSSPTTSWPTSTRCAAANSSTRAPRTFSASCTSEPLTRPLALIHFYPGKYDIYNLSIYRVPGRPLPGVWRR